MTELYITFFVLGVLIFFGVVLYSWLKQAGKSPFRFNGFGGKSKAAKPTSKAQQQDAHQQNNQAGNKLADEADLEPVLEENRQAPYLPDGQKGAGQKGAALQSTKQQRTDNASKGRISPTIGHQQQSKSTDSVTTQTKSIHSSLPVIEMTADDRSSAQDSDTRIADNVEIINVQPKRDEASTSIVTELVARVKNETAIEQKNLLTLFRNHDFKFHRKVHIYGLNQLTDLWCDVEYELPSARFVELGIAIQLADRDGGMTQKELHDFQQMALEFSNNFDAPFEFSMDIDEALVQAKVLDQIGRRYDSMAVLNVVPRSKAGFRSADIESCARDLDMSRNKKGIFMKTIGQKHQISVLYRLACTNDAGEFGFPTVSTEPVYDLVMYMNVPATKNPEIVFQDMVTDANSLATWLDGKVVDRDGKVMTQRSYSVLTQQISDIAFSMQQDGLLPGDDLSKKLF